MAQSRLEKIGTIFSRVQGLLRGGAMKTEDKPIWYDIYAAFPPKLEPRFDRPAVNMPVRNIFYAEDVVRAKLHKHNKPQETISLFDQKRATQSQQFIQIYEQLKSQGALDDQRIYETALDLLAEQRQQLRAEPVEENLEEDQASGKSTLLSDFREAGVQQQQLEKTPTRTKKEPSAGINIDSLFKD
ncbi:probable 28S ribosomal protein S23, mitochondrial [Drosophila grimshawi]|uniref:Small ribosomal subunit protein mS23 n=1 Tax=Drosophila grimshawi TaxID=7222 RepID=B4JCY0_DROGR|nr:probable 28S ribosomal protein S23, mitochondrial [Drosophila grimshawi]EDW03219.1 GH10614 [Drosophila grimshawi]